MTFDEALKIVSLISSTGVLAGGLGILKWGLTVERRLFRVEVKAGIE
jgi:hypothetical protein